MGESRWWFTLGNTVAALLEAGESPDAIRAALETALRAGLVSGDEDAELVRAGEVFAENLVRFTRGWPGARR